MHQKLLELPRCIINSLHWFRSKKGHQSAIESNWTIDLIYTCLSKKKSNQELMLLQKHTQGGLTIHSIYVSGLAGFIAEESTAIQPHHLRTNCNLLISREQKVESPCVSFLSSNRGSWAPKHENTLAHSLLHPIPKLKTNHVILIGIN